jgi:hypothetical protein
MVLGFGCKNCRIYPEQNNDELKILFMDASIYLLNYGTEIQAWGQLSEM